MLTDLGQKILDETIASLKGEYAQIPQSVKDIMPRAAMLVAQSTIGLTPSEESDLKHSMAILANVKVGGQIALNKLMLDTAANVLSAGLAFVRKLIGI